MTRTEARDAMLGRFAAAWRRVTPVFYDDASEDPPNGSWVRALVRHGVAAQASLANHEGKRSWERNGILTIQIHTPAGNGLVINDALTEIAVNAFQGKADNGLWYRNVRAQETGRDGRWFRTNVLVEFEYNEVR